MSELGKNWITEKHLDPEYKRYLLLAYLQKVSKKFNQSKLFPHLSDLKSHHDHLTDLRDAATRLYEGFSKEIKGIDHETMRFIYKSAVPDSEFMKTLKEIIGYSIPKIAACLQEGREIYDFLEEKIIINPVGIIPLNNEEGYMIIRNDSENTRMVYHYNITVYDKPDVPRRYMHTRYLHSFKKSITNTYEAIKRELVKANKELPNPATYAVESELEIPLYETYLPIAKNVLGKYISGSSGNSPADA